MGMSNYHVSVLLQEALHALQIKPEGKYIDATLGAGGHSKEIAQQGGIVLGIDQDEEARAESAKNVAGLHVTIVEGNFSRIQEIAENNKFTNVDGILFDLGVSSHQLDTNVRGFSFLSEGPLDMRMDAGQTVTAADLVNGLHKGELSDLFTKYGEEVFARRIADAIVVHRAQKPITTTKELADLIAKSVPKIGKIHPATKVFQALRIAVNDELHVVEDALPQALSLLKSGGRVVVISFHSLEDRIVKKTFEEFAEKGLGKIITKKPIVPTDEEMMRNRRSRSAKMRVFEKI